MIDALGRPRRLLLLGGTSEIARAVARRYASAGGLEHVVCAARPGPRRDEAEAELRALGVGVTCIDLAALAVESHQGVVDAAFDGGDVDVAVVAFGLLGDAEAAWQDHAVAVELARVNYVGAVSVGVLLGEAMRRQGHGVIVALSSVAGERVRRSNFVYGSTKAGMDGFYLGLGEALAGSGVRVVVVRPGFVRTAMTRGLPEAPLSVDADVVADAVGGAVVRGRSLVWVPAPLRPVMSALRHVPRPLFRRLPL